MASISANRGCMTGTHALATASSAGPTSRSRIPTPRRCSRSTSSRTGSAYERTAVEDSRAGRFVPELRVQAADWLVPLLVGGFETLVAALFGPRDLRLLERAG